MVFLPLPPRFIFSAHNMNLKLQNGPEIKKCPEMVILVKWTEQTGTLNPGTIPKDFFGHIFIPFVWYGYFTFYNPSLCQDIVYHLKFLIWLRIYSSPWYLARWMKTSVMGHAIMESDKWVYSALDSSRRHLGLPERKICTILYLQPWRKWVDVWYCQLVHRCVCVGGEGVGI